MDNNKWRINLKKLRQKTFLIVYKYNAQNRLGKKIFFVNIY